LERRGLRLGGDRGRQRGLHDHAVRRLQRAGRLRLRRARRDLAQAHATRADRRPESRLVAEDPDLDAASPTPLDEAAGPWDVPRDAVDRQLDCLRTAHAETIGAGEWAWIATGASTL